MLAQLKINASASPMSISTSSTYQTLSTSKESARKLLMMKYTATTTATHNQVNSDQFLQSVHKTSVGPHSPAPFRLGNRGEGF